MMFQPESEKTKHRMTGHPFQSGTPLREYGLPGKETPL